MDDFDIDILAEFDAATRINHPEASTMNFQSAACVSEMPFDAFISKGKEKDTFGCISKAKHYGDIFTCEESLSDYNVHVFWNNF